MIAEIHTNRGGRLDLRDGEEGNPEHEKLMAQALQLAESFGKWIHGFDSSGAAVVVPAASVNYIRICDD